MNLRSFLAVLLSLLITAPFAGAADYENIDELRQAVQSHTSKHYIQTYGKEMFDEQINLHLGNLDPRLKLVRCQSPYVFKINEPPHSSANITVKVSCYDQQRWTIYVPVTVDIYEDVVVAARSMNRGAVLEASDLEFRRVNIARYGSGQVEDPQRLVGKELSRALRAGDAIKVSFVRDAEIVRKGDTVVVEAHSQTLSVAVSGEALAGGSIGQQIKVKNTQSKRVVDALVVGPGKVRVMSW